MFQPPSPKDSAVLDSQPTNTAARSKSAQVTFRWDDPNLFEARKFALLLGASLLICFSAPILGLKVFFFRDYAIFGYPLAAYHREAFWSGEIPLWNPYIYCGVPHLAQWNTMVLYPGALIYLLLPLPWSLNLFCLAHLFLGGLGMRALAKRWSGDSFGACVAGLAFAWGGLALSCLKWPNNLAALGLMPWVVWLVDRSREGGAARLLAAIIVASCQMLSGAPEIILFTWAVVALFWVAEIPAAFRAGRVPAMVLRLAVLVVAVSALCAAQLLPFFELLGASQRDSLFADAQWAMPLWGPLNFIAPLFHTFPSHQGVHAQPGQFWISTYYAGIVVLTLAALACAAKGAGKRLWFPVAASLLGIVLAMGDSGWLYKAVTDLFPLLKVLRFPIKFVTLAAFCLPLAAAMGVKLVSQGRVPNRGWIWVASLLAVGFIGVAAAAIAAPLASESVGATLSNVLLRVFFWIAGAMLFHRLMDTAAGSARGNKARLALLGVIFLDGATHTPWQNPTANPWVYDKAMAKLEPLPVLGTSRAFVTPATEKMMDFLSLRDPNQDVVSSRMTLFANINLIDRIPKVDGFLALFPAEFSRVNAILHASTNSMYPGILKFLGVSQISGVDGRYEWGPISGGMPWLAGGARPVQAALGETVAAMTDPAFNPEQTVFLPLGALPEGVSIAPSNVVFSGEHWANHEVRAAISAPAPAIITLSQAFDRNWRVAVNGVAVAPFVANLGFIGFQVPAGSHQVRIWYQSPAFTTGASISLAALAATLIVGTWLWRRQT